MSRIALFLVCALGGCTSSLGSVVRIPLADDSGVKLLRPGATGRSCRSSIIGIRRGGAPAGLEEALAQIRTLDEEGDVVTNAEVFSEQFLTGVYNRRCVVVRGDLGRVIPTLVLPSPGGHHH